MKTKILIALLALTGAVLYSVAQDTDVPPPPPGGPEGGHHHRHPPLPPIFLALDTNHDGVIDAQEIANAPAALRSLDKNGDGKLTIDELMPPPPPPPGDDDDGQGPPPPPEGN